MRVISLVILSLLMPCVAAAACPGQAGKVIFDDNFADDSGGWQLYANYEEIKGNALLIHPSLPADANASAIFVQNLTFSAGPGDYCADIILPKQEEADNPVVAGIVFWRISSNDQFYVYISTAKALRLLKRAGGSWATIYDDSAAPVKLGPGDVNTLRVLAKDDKITVFLNGAQVKVVRAQMPAGNLQFGIQAETIKHTATDPVVQIKNFNVTAGP